MRTSRPRTKFTATDLFDALTVREVAELEHRRIAARIKQARKEAGLKQHEMAEFLGVIQRTYQNYESETAPRIPWDRMNDIQRITGKKVEWLLHGETPDPFANGDLYAERLDDIDRKLDTIIRDLTDEDAESTGGADPLPDPGPLGPSRPPTAPSKDAPPTRREERRRQGE